MHLDPKVLDRVRELRRNGTPPEKLLWSILRNRQLAGLKFRRQYPVPPYYVDFCCVEHSLIVELDGRSHEDKVESDAQRTAHLERAGYRVVRFTNYDVADDVEAVAKAIL